MGRKAPGNQKKKTAAIKTTIRLDTRLADEAMKVFRVKSRTEAVRAALQEIVSLKRSRAEESNRK